MTEPTEQAAAEEESTPTKQAEFFSIPSLEELNDALEEIFRDPIRSGVAQTDAEASVLGHVGSAYFNQDQIPIRTGTSAARGAFVALMAAVRRLECPSFRIVGDFRPAESERLTVEQDANGRLNPMLLFEDDMELALYPTASIRARLSGIVEDDYLDRSIGRGSLMLTLVEDYVDWATWMDTFAR